MDKQNPQRQRRERQDRPILPGHLCLSPRGPSPRAHPPPDPRAHRALHAAPAALCALQRLWDPLPSVLVSDSGRVHTEVPDHVTAAWPASGLPHWRRLEEGSIFDGCGFPTSDTGSRSPSQPSILRGAGGPILLWPCHRGQGPQPSQVNARSVGPLQRERDRECVPGAPRPTP